MGTASSAWCVGAMTERAPSGPSGPRRECSGGQARGLAPMRRAGMGEGRLTWVGVVLGRLAAPSQHGCRSARPWPDASWPPSLCTCKPVDDQDHHPLLGCEPDGDRSACPRTRTAVDQGRARAQRLRRLLRVRDAVGGAADRLAARAAQVEADAIAQLAADIANSNETIRAENDGVVAESTRRSRSRGRRRSDASGRSLAGSATGVLASRSLPTFCCNGVAVRRASGGNVAA